MNWLKNEVTLGPLTFRNRTIMAPMTRRMSPGGLTNQEMIDYYIRRIDGGVGGIISEGILIDSRFAGAESNVPTVTTEGFAAAWKPLTSYAEDVGVPVLAQLWHQGTYSKNTSGYFRLSPSGIPTDESRISRSMTLKDIDRTVEDYAHAGAIAVESGFAGVEIHGAHGYLLDSFAWHKTNLRDDLYGGQDIQSRMSFPAEVVVALKDSVGAAGAISYRFSQWKTNLWTARNFDSPDELQKGLSILSDAGVDVFHASTRRYWSPAFPELSGVDGTRSLAGWVKKLTGIPTIAVGSIGVPRVLDKQSEAYGEEELLHHTGQLAREQIDLVAVGRALLADPDWVRHVLAGRISKTKAYVPQHKLALS